MKTTTRCLFINGPLNGSWQECLGDSFAYYGPGQRITKTVRGDKHYYYAANERFTYYRAYVDSLDFDIMIIDSATLYRSMDNFEEHITERIIQLISDMIDAPEVTEQDTTFGWSSRP